MATVHDMEITIFVLGQERTRLVVSSDLNIAELKRRILASEDARGNTMSEQNVHLRHRSTSLDNAESLAHYGISDDAQLHLDWRRDEAMLHLHVRLPVGAINMVCELGAPVGTVRRTVLALGGLQDIGRCHQLLYGGEVLRGGYSISDYDIFSDSSLTLERSLHLTIESSGGSLALKTVGALEPLEPLWSLCSLWSLLEELVAPLQALTALNLWRL